MLPWAEALSDDACLTSVCLSHTSGLNREQRPRKTTISKQVAHVTRDSDIIFKVKGSNTKVTWSISPNSATVKPKIVGERSPFSFHPSPSLYPFAPLFPFPSLPLPSGPLPALHCPLFPSRPLPFPPFHPFPLEVASHLNPAIGGLEERFVELKNNR